MILATWLGLLAATSARAELAPLAIEGAHGCFDFPEVRRMGAGPHPALFRLKDAVPGAQLIMAPPGAVVPAAAALHPTLPCPNATGSPAASACSCSSFANGQSAGCPAFMYAGPCWCLGDVNASASSRAALLNPANASAGVAIYVGGGASGSGCGTRGTMYKMVCDPDAAPNAGPTEVVEHLPANCDVTVTWPTPAACVTAPSTGCPVPPKPTPDQVVYHRMEVGALISFNMATAAGSQGCGPGAYPPASTFNDLVPTAADTDQWCQAIASFGGRWATLVAKHECGFALWPTKAASGGFVYNYSVPEGVDYVQQLAESCAAVGVKLGIYYSVNANSYLDVWNNGVGAGKVTAAQYEDIVLQQLEELWGNYGPLAEIWFDGGTGLGAETVAKMVALKDRLQPQAVTFGGCNAMPVNSVAWVGTESGHAPYPLWYARNDCGMASTGDPMGTKVYMPYEVDTTLQNADSWFFNEGVGYKSIVELAGQYHDSVGHGGNLLLNLAPPPNTTIPAAAMVAYAELGNWTKRCYGVGTVAAAGALATTTAPCRHCANVTIALKRSAPTVVDRFLIKEELLGGQRILAFSISVDGGVGVVYRGTAVGSAHIAILDNNITAAAAANATLSIEATRGGPATVNLFAVPDPADCGLPPAGGGCAVVADMLYQGPAFKTLGTSTVQACCGACRAAPTCAVFTAVLGTQWPYTITCSLMGAMTGSAPQSGAFSGSPVRGS